jgi:hypothetical protein
MALIFPPPAKKWTNNDFSLYTYSNNAAMLLTISRDSWNDSIKNILRYEKIPGN